MSKPPDSSPAPERAGPARALRLPVAHLATLAGLMGLHVAAALGGGAAVWLTAPLAAAALLALFGVMHETAHGTYFGHRRADALVGRLAGALLLQSFSRYRRLHMLHHAFQGGPRDPEEVVELRRRRDLWRALLWNGNYLADVAGSLRSALTGARAGARRDGWIAVAALSFALGATALWPAEALLVYWAPWALFLLLDAAVSLPEHARAPALGEDGRVTRSLTAGPVVDFLLYWVNQHEAHHAAPTLSAAARRAERPAESYAGFYRRVYQALA